MELPQIISNATALRKKKKKKAINDAGPLLGRSGFDADELSLLRANKMFEVEKTVNTNNKLK